MFLNNQPFLSLDTIKEIPGNSSGALEPSLCDLLSVSTVYPTLSNLLSLFFALHKVTTLLLQNLYEVLFLSFEQKAKNLKTPGLDTRHF